MCQGLFVLQTYFYPRSPCGERRQAQNPKVTTLSISIHALLAESDLSSSFLDIDYYISIHALLAESDLDLTLHERRRIVFLSTLSLRRATAEFFSIGQPVVFLSTLSLRRATLRFSVFNLLNLSFLSTLSLRRATIITKASGNLISYFYPRSPCGERPFKGN